MQRHFALLLLLIFVSSGPNWPAGGEIDILEGVHDYTNNQATLHTDIGCTLSSTDSKSLRISGSVLGGTSCAAATTGNTGCGIRASTSISFGAGFNANGGGIYASRCLSTHDNCWCLIACVQCSGMNPASQSSFSLKALNQMISLPKPHIQRTGVQHRRGGLHPAATHSNSSTARTRSLIRLSGMSLIAYEGALFTNKLPLSGDWGGQVWATTGIPGQEQSCAQRTGFSTCEAFVRASGSSFNEACKWSYVCSSPLLMLCNLRLGSKKCKGISDEELSVVVGL